MAEASLRAIDRALIRLRRLWTAPAQLSDPELGRVEMSTIWVAEALSDAGSGRDMTVGDVAAALDVAQSTASRLVDRAERSGVIRRTRSAHDGRRVALQLTAAGQALARRSASFRLGYLQRVTGSWTAADRAAFAAHLERFAAAVRDTPPQEGTS